MAPKTPKSSRHKPVHSVTEDTEEAPTTATWDSTPIEKASWFNEKLEKAADHDPAFLQLVQTATVTVK